MMENEISFIFVANEAHEQWFTQFKTQIALSYVKASDEQFICIRDGLEIKMK